MPDKLPGDSEAAKKCFQLWNAPPCLRVLDPETHPRHPAVHRHFFSFISFLHITLLSFHNSSFAVSLPPLLLPSLIRFLFSPSIFYIYHDFFPTEFLCPLSTYEVCPGYLRNESCPPPIPSSPSLLLSPSSLLLSRLHSSSSTSSPSRLHLFSPYTPLYPLPIPSPSHHPFLPASFRHPHNTRRHGQWNLTSQMIHPGKGNQRGDRPYRELTGDTGSSV